MQNKKALVVDSNAVSCELLHILLEHQGYQSIETGDTREAVELAAATSPDVILIDLQLPRLEAYATAGKLRQDGRFKNLIVALTERDSDPARIAAAGFSTCLSKPVVLRGLRESLAQLPA